MAGATSLAAVAAAIDSCSSDAADTGAQARVRQALGEAIAVVHQAGDVDAPQAEALLRCVLEALATAGERGRVLLQEMVLELLPPLASLAPRSDACCRHASALAALAAACCAPRDTITALLEVLDTLLADSHGQPATLQFLCGLVAMLPAQLARLSRRKAAFAAECCPPVAALARAHGEVLGAWALSQLALAAQQRQQQQQQQAKAADVLRPLDTFLGASWQVYADFVQDVLQQVLPQEQDAAARDKARHALALLVLQLLQGLTLLWPPPALQPLALQLVATPTGAAHLPSAESVAAPAAMAATMHAGRQQAGDAAAPPAPRPPQQPSIPSTRLDAQAAAAAAIGAHRTQVAQRDSDAAQTVLDLLRLLRLCGCTSWQQLISSQEEQAGAVAGAGLAALYDSCLQPDGPQQQQQQQQPDSLAPLQDAVATMQAACTWCCAVAEAADNNVLALLKATALLQLAAAQQLLPPDEDGGAAALPTAALPQLQACISLLAGVVSHAPVQALRSQAAVGLQQLLQGLPARARHACLQHLLSGGGGDQLAGGPGVHPEEAALLMQEVRLQLASAAAGAQQGKGSSTSFSPDSCMQLVLPWLLQQGPAGWSDAATLPDRANAICAALAVVRLVLLTGQQQQHAAGSVEEHKRLLQAPLASLAAAVRDALTQLAAAAADEDGQPGGGPGGSSSSDGRRFVPGDACGAGQAVDAWLAVSRVQDVLERVQELLV